MIRAIGERAAVRVEHQVGQRAALREPLDALAREPAHVGAAGDEIGHRAVDPRRRHAATLRFERVAQADQREHVARLLRVPVARACQRVVVSVRGNSVSISASSPVSGTAASGGGHTSRAGTGASGCASGAAAAGAITSLRLSTCVADAGGLATGIGVGARGGGGGAGDTVCSDRPAAPLPPPPPATALPSIISVSGSLSNDRLRLDSSSPPSTDFASTSARSLDIDLDLAPEIAPVVVVVVVLVGLVVLASGGLHRDLHRPLLRRRRRRLRELRQRRAMLALDAMWPDDENVGERLAVDAVARVVGVALRAQAAPSC